MDADHIFPASWFVVAFVGLWLLIFVAAYFYIRRHGHLGDVEAIKYKVFDDGIPNPQPVTAQQSERPARKL